LGLAVDEDDEDPEEWGTTEEDFRSNMNAMRLADEL